MLEYFKNKRMFVFAVIFLLVFWAYWPSLFNGFISWDDNIYVVENEIIRYLSLASLKTIFTTDVSLNYTPLTSLSFALEYHAFGYEPFYYHLNNFILHYLVTVLIFIFSLRLSKSTFTAFFAALLFGLHPMHVESVAWVTERKDVLYSFFYMLALIFYWDFLDGRQKKLSFALSLLCGFLSILAKPMALSLPLVLFVLDWFHGRKFDLKNILLKIPFFLATVPVAWLTYSLNSRPIELRFPESFLAWLWTGVFYIKKFFLPFEFLPLYQLPKPVVLTNPEYVSSAAIAVLIVFFLARFNKDRWLVFSFLFYFVSIFFLLRFDDTVDLSVVADRFMYLPSLGFCILAGVYCQKTCEWVKLQSSGYQKMFWTTVLGVFLFLGFSTFEQTKIWGHEIAFWDKVIRRYPEAFMAYNQRALAYKNKGQFDEALKDYTRAILLFPDYDYALTNRGIAYKELGRFDEAWEDHSRAIAINPGFSEAYLNRGNVAFSAGNMDLAIADYDKAVINLASSARRNLTLYRAEVYSRRGAGYFFKKDYENALRDFNQALKIDPNNIVALDNRAIIFSVQGEKDKALVDFAKSLKIAPWNPVIYVNRAQLFYETGDRISALADLETALSLKPDYQRAVALRNILQQ